MHVPGELELEQMCDRAEELAHYCRLIRKLRLADVIDDNEVTNTNKLVSELAAELRARNHSALANHYDEEPYFWETD